MFHYRIVVLTFCLLTSACSFRSLELPLPTPDADNIIYVTATPLPAVMQAAPTQTPTEPPPTALPTPNIDANQMLARAANMTRNGYLEDAAGLYRNLLNYGDAIAPAQRAEAGFRFGQVALRSGYFEQAQDAFSVFIAEFPSDAHAAQAYFLRADARLGLSQWSAAIADLQAYLLLRSGLIDSYVYERIADARIALAQTESALENYELAISAKRSKVPLLILREKLARIYINLERHAAAIAQYDAILTVARNIPYRANISLMAARAALNSVDGETGLARMAAVAENYPGTAAAWEAQDQLSRHGAAVDGFRRGQAALIAGDAQAAIDAFNQHTTTQNEAAIPAELFLLLGRAYRQIGNFGAAAVAFQTLIDRYPQDPLLGDALLERGRTRFLAGDSRAAIEIYLALAEEYDYLASAAGEALWRAGYLYGTSGQTTASRQVFTRMADRYPDHELTTNGLFIAASAAVRDEEWRIAEGLYGRIAALTTGDDQAAANLWIGRIALGRGDASAANDAFGRAIAAAPDSYFAARAADFRIGRQPFQAPGSYRFDFDDESERKEAEDWLRRTFTIAEASDLWQMSEALEGDPRMIRARELITVGAFAEAYIEFEDLVDEARETGDVLSSYRLAVYLRALGAYRESIIAAADVIIASGLGTLQAPRYIARLRFPAYYIDVIRPAAAERALDPLLMLSLIRQESLFNTFATAAAGEKGLMQVIPPTAQYIAEQLAWPDYQHADLFRPYAGVAFGAYYIDEQLRLFDRNAVVALAAYNAGPGRAYDWNALSDGDPDLFMTTITIDSTRHYVQFIYRNYNIYRELYGAGE
ncbi:MAG: transglycosylase SLT domain-containing protein [Chloroflexota bacterium]|nr:transglycosylase SLT domain-containing protein [Chloroflexota bacterium]MDE2909295.1 transglycosylase SLT domain-containing protein [Chloroflexota bacterium]